MNNDKQVKRSFLIFCFIQTGMGVSVFALIRSMINWLPGITHLPELFSWSFPLLLSSSSLLMWYAVEELSEKLKQRLFILDCVLWGTTISGILLLLTTTGSIEGKTGLNVCFLIIFALKSALIGYSYIQSQKIKPLKPYMIFLFALWFLGFHGCWQWPDNSVTGDEPHYLLMTHSIVNDADLNLFNEYTEKAYSEYYSGILEPKPSDINSRGLIFSRGLGATFPLLLAPAYAIGGYNATRLFMILCAVLLILQLYLLLMKEINQPVQVLLAVFLVGSTIPVISYASLIYPDILAALLIVSGLRLLQIPPLSRQGRSVPALLVLISAVLVFLKFRYFVPAILLILPLFQREFRKKGKVLILTFSVTIFAILYIIVDSYLLGGDLFSNRFGHLQIILKYLPDWSSLKVIPGLLFDQESGILVYAQIYFLSFAGIRLYKYAKTPVYWFALSCVPLTVISLLGHFAWHCLPTPPLRYLLPVLPVTALFISVVFIDWKKRSFLFRYLTISCISLSWFISFITTLDSSLLTNFADGSAEIMVQAGQLLNIPLARFFPSLIRPDTNLWIWIPILLFLLFSITFPKFRDSDNKQNRFQPVLYLSSFIITLVLLFSVLDNSKLEIYHAEDRWWSRPTGGKYYPEIRDPFFHKETIYGWSISPEDTIETQLLTYSGNYSLVLTCKLSGTWRAQHIKIYLGDRLEGRITVSSHDWAAYGLRINNLPENQTLTLKASHKNSADITIDSIQLIRVKSTSFSLWTTLANFSRKLDFKQLTCKFMTRAFLVSPGDPWFEIHEIIPGAKQKIPKAVLDNPLPPGFIDQYVKDILATDFPTIHKIEFLTRVSFRQQLQPDETTDYILSGLVAGAQVAPRMAITQLEQNNLDANETLVKAAAIYLQGNFDKALNILDEYLLKACKYPLYLEKPGSFVSKENPLQPIFNDMENNPRIKPLVNSITIQHLIKSIAAYHANDYKLSASHLDNFYLSDHTLFMEKIPMISPDFCVRVFPFASRIHPADTKAIIEIALKNNRFLTVLAASEYGMRMFPADPDILYSRALALFYMKKYYEARETCLMSMAYFHSNDRPRWLMELIIQRNRQCSLENGSISAKENNS